MDMVVVYPNRFVNNIHILIAKRSHIGLAYFINISICLKGNNVGIGVVPLKIDNAQPYIGTTIDNGRSFVFGSKFIYLFHKQLLDAMQVPISIWKNNFLAK